MPACAVPAGLAVTGLLVAGLTVAGLAVAGLVVAVGAVLAGGVPAGLVVAGLLVAVLSSGVHPVSMAAVATLLTVLFGYLLGSVPVARLVTRRDLRTTGDGNPGYWNAQVTLGRRAALPVFIGDVAKGAGSAAAGVVLAWSGQWWLGYIGGFAAMVGHAWPVFDHFRGGRSVLCFAGAVCVLSPVTAAVAIGVLIAVFAVTRSFAWGARVAVFSFPFIQLAVDGPYRTAATGALMTLIGLRFLQASRAAGVGR